MTLWNGRFGNSVGSSGIKSLFQSIPISKGRKLFQLCFPEISIHSLLLQPLIILLLCQFLNLLLKMLVGIGCVEDLIPCCNWATFVNLLNLDCSSCSLHFGVGENVESTGSFFSESETRYFVQLHSVLPVLLSKPLFPSKRLNIIPDLIPCLLILFPEILLIESLLILNFH